MSGNGGYKHKQVRIKRKREQREQKGRENLARIRNQFETRGQVWDPLNDSAQMAALTHYARRLVSRSVVHNH